MKRIFLISALILTALAACRREPQRLHPFKWESLENKFDSLTIRLELEIANNSPLDSIRQSLESMGALAEASHEDRKTMESRLHYWRARYCLQKGKIDSAWQECIQALDLNDSVRHVYDFYRIKTGLYSISHGRLPGDEEYKFYEKALAYSRKIKDTGFEAMILTNLGNLYSDIKEYDKAMDCYVKSDSLNSLLRFKGKIGNKINIANIYTTLSQKEKADSILHRLLQNQSLENDLYSRNLVLMNLYRNNPEDTAILRKGLNMVSGDTSYRNLRGLYRGLFAAWHFNHNQVDSAFLYTGLAFSDLPYVSELKSQALIFAVKKQTFVITGSIDSVYAYHLEYQAVMDSILRQQKPLEVYRLSALQEMNMMDKKYLARIYRRNIISLLVVLAVIILGMVTYMNINRRHTRQKLAILRSEMELERTRRKMMVSFLSIEEKDKVLDSLREELSGVRGEKKLEEGKARSLETSIKVHLSSRETEDAYMKMMDVVNPGFVERLKERCPDLADSYVKLASYIIMGMDNKRIAKHMMIKPESVRQARWRLSRRLNVAEGESLEDLLRELNQPE